MSNYKNTGDGLSPVEQRGVWAAYYSDMSGVAVFASEIEALRYAVGNSMTVAFWEFGKDLNDMDNERRRGA